MQKAAVALIALKRLDIILYQTADLDILVFLWIPFIEINYNLEDILTFESTIIYESNNE